MQRRERSSVVPNWTAQEVFLATVTVTAVIAAFTLLYYFRGVALALLVAVILSTAFRPAVEWLHRRGMSRMAAVILIYLVAVLVLAGILLSLVPLITVQVSDIVSHIPGYYRSLRLLMVGSSIRLLRRIGSALPSQVTISPTSGGQTGPLQPLTSSVSLLLEGVRTFFGLVSVLLLAFYWTLEGDAVIRGALALLSAEKRAEIGALVADAQEKLGAFLRAEGLLMLLVGTANLIAYLIIGIPSPLVLALFAGLLEAVPTIGPVLAAVPALILGLAISPLKGLWVFLAATIIQQLENYLLVPRVMKNIVGANPVLTLLALAAFGSLLGVVGALIAVPLAVVIQLVLRHLVLSPEPEGESTAMAGSPLQHLRQEAQAVIQDIRAELQHKEAPPEQAPDDIEDSLELIANDLDRLLREAQRERGRT